MKLLAWLVTVLVLFIGMRHYHEDMWAVLLFLFIIDVPSTILLRRDIARGADFGNPLAELLGAAKDAAGGEAAARLGRIPGAAYDAWSARNEPEVGVGARMFANMFWTPGLLGVAGYCIYHWWWL
jgi:hypothetical protein